MAYMNRKTGTAARFGAMLPIVLLSYFIILLNNSIVFTSTVRIAADLSMDKSLTPWLSNAYALTFGGFLLLAGRLGDVFGRKRLFLAGLAVFAVGSLLVGCASSAGMLIAMRALQGIGGAILAPTSLALLIDAYDGERLTAAVAYYGATAGIGSSIGLIFGGLIASYASWRLGFLMNVPVAVILLLISMRWVPNHNAQTAQSRAAVDWLGAILSVVAFSALVFAISSAAWRLPVMGLAIVALTVFIWVEHRTSAALTPLSLFTDPGRDAAYAGRFFALAGSMSYFFLMPQAMQRAWGWSPLQSAIAFLPLTVIQFLASLTVAPLTKRWSNAKVLVIGATINVAGYLIAIGMRFERGYWLAVAVPMLLIGIGQGLVMSPLTVGGVAGVPADDSGAASGVVNTMHQIGGAAGLAFVSSMVAGITSPISSIDRAQVIIAVFTAVMLVCGVVMLLVEHDAHQHRSV